MRPRFKPDASDANATAALNRTSRRREPRIATARPALRDFDEAKGATLLTAKDLEAWLRIDVKTIYSYVQRGLLPYIRIESNLRFVRQQILDWIEEHNYRP